MANTPYLAMTAAEFMSCGAPPPKLGWMACHFSPYGRGLSNIPKALPPSSMLILNDRIEPNGIDPELVATQLAQAVEALACNCVLLDLQRPGNDVTKVVAQAVCESITCPVAVSGIYAAALRCAVFLPPPDLREDPATYFAPWNDREIWLEVYDQWEMVTVKQEDAESDFQIPSPPPALPHFDTKLNCQYGIEVMEDRAVFTLHRSIHQWQDSTYPITNLIALWQDYSS
jgi:hypothetical protein